MDDTELFAPMDDLLERIANNLQDLYKEEDDPSLCNTETQEENILSYISDLDLDELERVETRDKDGLYIDPNDSSYYALVKDGQTLLAFESQ